MAQDATETKINKEGSHMEQIASYPQSFHPEALWCVEEICGYLHIKRTRFYEIEYRLNTVKVGRRRVARAEDVISYAKQQRAEQNPLAL